MRIAIIGAGNMGGAIARGLAKGSFIKEEELTVSNPSNGKLERLKAEFPRLHTTNSNQEAVMGADIIILAVKPWKVEEVLVPLQLHRPQILVSVAAGVTFEALKHYVATDMTLFRVIPNTAIAEGASMTLVAAHNATSEQTDLQLSLFNEMGLSIMLEEKQLSCATALTSCGIAYVFKYVQAAMQAGVEGGLRPKEAQRMLAQTLKGAAEILLKEDAHPSVEIDKVTTPGGITIKGVNELEHNGFSSAVIKAIKASL